MVGRRGKLGEDARTRALMLEREAHGVRLAMLARIALCGLGIVSLPFTASTAADQYRTFLVCVLGLTVGFIGMRNKRSAREVTRIGLVGVGFDIVVLMLLPWSWYDAVGGPSAVPASFVAKTDLTALAVPLLAVNTFTLRPLYPACVAVAVSLQEIGLVLYGLADPRTVTTMDPLEAHMGPGLHVGFIGWRVVTLLLVGAMMALLTVVARRMVWRVAAAELESAELRAQEARRVASAKLAGLTGLVAGLAHEINTPLGAMVSGAGSAETARRRLVERMEAAPDLEALRADKKVQRALDALQATSGASREAGARIQALVGALKDFARLDQADSEQVDLRKGLDSTLELVPVELRGEVEIVRDYAEVPEVSCRAREINQVFMTLVENALDAMQGRGTLTLRVRSIPGHVQVLVEDTGPGIPAETLDQIFELRFHRNKARVGMGLGLPVGRKVLVEHGGRLEVTSPPGAGAQFTVELPISGSGPPRSATA